MNGIIPFNKGLRICTTFLTMVSVPVLIIGAELSSNTIGEYGLISNLSYVYIAGLVCCLASLGLESISSSPSETIMWLDLLITVAYLWIGPILIFPGLPMPAEGHDLQYYSTTASITSSGHLNPQAYIYQSWPGAYLFFAIVKMIFFPLSYVQLYRLVPLVYNLLVLIVTFCFSRSFVGRKHVAIPFIAAGFMELFNFSTTLTSVSPFSFPFVIFYAAVFLIFSLKLEGASLKRLSIISFIFFISLSTIHPEIAFVAIVAIFSMSVPAIIKREISIWNALQLPILGLLFDGCWTLIAALPFLNNFGPSTIFGSLFHITTSLVSGSVERFAGISSAYSFIDSIRLVLFLVLVSGMFPVLIMRSFMRHRSYLMLLSMILFIGIAFVVVGNAQGQSYPVRVFAYLLPIIVVMDVISIFQLPRKIVMPALILALIISGPVSLTVLYGDLGADYVPPASIQSSVFFSSHVSLSKFSQPPVILTDQLIGDYGYNLSTIYPFSYPAWVQSALGSNAFQFIALGHLSINIESFLIPNGSTIISNAMDNLSINPNYDTVYSSGVVVLYSWNAVI